MKIYCRLFQNIMRASSYVLPWKFPKLFKGKDVYRDIINVLDKKRTVLIITDKNIRKLSLLDNLLKELEKANVNYQIFDNVHQNPTIENVENALKKYKKYNCYEIITVGGGSPMDCAKIVAARIAKPKQSVKKMTGLLRIRKKLVPIIAIPTTAGTGSETTIAAVITDGEVHEKHVITDTCLTPKYAAIIPELTKSLPPNFTSTTGMDALTHAIEAYIGNSNTRDTKKNALMAIELIRDNLFNAYSDGNNLEARRNMLHASYLAGLAFTRGYVGNVHAIAHTLGGKYQVPHGLANSVLLLPVLRAYGKKIYKPLSEISDTLKLTDIKASKATKAEAVLNWIEKLKSDMNIPDSIPQIKLEDIDSLVNLAYKEANPFYPVPVIFTKNDFKLLYIEASGVTNVHNIEEGVLNQREFFNSKKTLDLNFRRNQLDLLYKQIKKYEKEVILALKEDLNKSEFESYATEIGLIYEEIRYMKNNLKHLAKRKWRKSPIVHFPSTSYTYKDPYGTVLIMSPWNYPFQLSMMPLIGAIAAGNCVALKPSNYSPATSKVLAKILSAFPDEYIFTALGGRAKNQALLDQKFDYIFFTGGLTVGKLVMEKAAAHLTPLTLELGGKSPCIVDSSANIDLAAKRIVWGKFLNAGQTCVAPDYILVDKNVKRELIKSLRKYIVKFFGEHPETNKEYCKIINQTHFDRLSKLIPPDKLHTNPSTLQIAPAILENSTWDSKVMEEEIFGPILPIITFSSIDEVISELNKREKPLAEYLFTTSNGTIDRITKETFFGGGCINDTVIHVSNSNIPFGGVGNSGLGGYHGKESFNLFSHTKSIMKKSNLLDINIRYAPYKGKIGIIRLLMR